VTFEELDYRSTDLGELVLRRRRSPSHGNRWIHEITLDGEFLMSSAVHDAETALATEVLPRFDAGDGKLRVLVGGLGLGHTAAAVLDDPRVSELVVVELLAPVIQWHKSGMVPLGRRLCGDPRCSLVRDDFFEFVGRSSNDASDRFDVILLDIDHSPEQLLHSRHGAFYEGDGAATLVERLDPHGVFALWSADDPDVEFISRLDAVFAAVECRSLRFPVPHLQMEDVNTIVVASL